MLKDLAQLRCASLAAALRRCALFSELPAGDLEWIASFVVQKRLAKGDYLFREGAPFEGFYVVDQGAINVHRVSAAGKAQFIHLFQAGESFAEAALADDTPYPADARAVESSSVLLVPKSAFLELLRKRPELALRMLGSMSRHLHSLVRLIDNLRLKGVQTRLAGWLLKRCPKPLSNEPTLVELDRPKGVLAGELGTTSETLSRTLSELRARKLIAVRGRIIIIQNPAELERLFRCSAGELLFPPGHRQC
jgi:CRP/FNR family transcriptional regulator